MSIKTLVLTWIRRLLIDSPDVACRLVKKDVMQKMFLLVQKACEINVALFADKTKSCMSRRLIFFQENKKMQINSSKAEGENSFENCILLV